MPSHDPVSYPCVAYDDEHGHRTEDGRITDCGLNVRPAPTQAELKRGQRIPNRCRRCYPVTSGTAASVEATGQPGGPRPPAPRAPVRVVAGRRPKRRKPAPSTPAPPRVELEPDGWAELQDMCQRLDAAANSATRASKPRSALQ